jgi:hypothetical protein
VSQQFLIAPYNHILQDNAGPRTNALRSQPTRVPTDPDNTFQALGHTQQHAFTVRLATTTMPRLAKPTSATLVLRVQRRLLELSSAIRVLQAHIHSAPTCRGVSRVILAPFRFRRLQVAKSVHWVPMPQWKAAHVLRVNLDTFQHLQDHRRAKSALPVRFP